MAGISFDDALETLTWRCTCDYVNVATDRCAHCGRCAVGTAPLPPPREVHQTAPPSTATIGGGRALAGATALVAAVILLNVVLQGAIAAAGRRAGVADLSHGLQLTLGAGLVFFGLVGTGAIVAMDKLRLRPTVFVGAKPAAVARGLLTGGGIGLALGLIGRAAGSGDPLSTLIASDGSVGVLLLGVLVIVMVGPAVEELVFRGLFGEALRGRGKTAIWISAAAFSLAHLRLAQFRYFVWMGVVFGAVWWSRGLIASITAHAAFNGALLAVAVLGAHGPAITMRSDIGATWRLPANWHAVRVPAEDLGAIGPHGATVEVAHADGSLPVNLDAVATGLRSGITPAPGFVTDVASVRTTSVSGRAAVTVRSAAGDGASMVLVADGARRWVIVGQHIDDATFVDLLRDLTLP